MARDVYVKAQFNDAGNFPNEKRYLLTQTMADDGSDMDDVLAAAVDLVTALDVLTWDKIDPITLEIVIPQAGADPNVGANNRVEAFHRMTDNVTGKPAHFVVPAWDDFTFDALPNGALSTAYNLAAAAVAALTRNPETGNAWSYVAAQNRSVKRGQRLYKL
jgi:hypothetical protein